MPIQLKTKSFKLSFALLTAAALGGLMFFKHKKRQSTKLNAQQQQQQPELNQDQLQQQVENVEDDFKYTNYLTQRLAQRRFDQVQQHSIHYYLNLKLMKGTHYEGILQAEMELKHVDYDLFMEFKGESISKLIVNNQNIQPTWNGLFLRIPKDSLKLNEPNTIVIQFRNKYAGDGNGLHSTIDSDGKQYLYSQGESFFCNRFFPVMDQPDLKAKLQLNLVSPAEWTVIHNENYYSNEQFQFDKLLEKNKLSKDLLDPLFEQVSSEEYKLWKFSQTNYLPSYLFALVAGHYYEYKWDQKVRHITFSVYCRESLKEQLDKMKDFILETTKKSMEFYENFFGVEYQFTKYDSIFVAEYNWGAMENPGCVTFNDIYLFREEVPIGRYAQLANTIAHEMAHHWFGDYVTMKWWNDLWLNESYADFISHYCLQKINLETKKLGSIPVMFNLRKAWGYREDQMVTTHPIAGEVPNTEVAENIFDGITYAKGASTMHQLLTLVDPAAFGKACGAYFKKYGWSNATLDNLIEALNDVFAAQKHDFTLFDWKEEWICKAGMNEVIAEWNPNDESNEAVLRIKQTPALAHLPTLRRHKMQVAFFKEDGNADVQNVLLKNEEYSEVKYNGSQKYKAVLLNYSDQTFIKVLLDQESLNFFKHNLHLVKESINRTLIWRAFYDTVRDAKICSEEYMEVLFNCLPKEESDDIVNTQILYLSTAISSMTPRSFKKELSVKIFDFLSQKVRELLDKNDENLKNRMMIYRTGLFYFTQHDDTIQKLVDWWWDKNETLKGLEITNDNKWSIVSLVHASKKYDKGEDGQENQLRKQLLEEQCNNDKSDKQDSMVRKCKALIASKEEREQLWNSYIDLNNQESIKKQGASMSGFNNARRFEALQEYQEKFFQVIVEIFEKKTSDQAKTFYEHLFPITDDLSTLSKLVNDTLAKTPDSSVTLKKYLSKSLDDIQRKVRQFEVFGSQAQIAKQ